MKHMTKSESQSRSDRVARADSGYVKASPANRFVTWCQIGEPGFFQIDES
jgi:hypothetical protein